MATGERVFPSTFPGVRHELCGFGQTPLPPTGTFSHAEDLIEGLQGVPAALVGASRLLRRSPRAP
jgi:hypothetical protein